jgi:protein gp37
MAWRLKRMGLPQYQDVVDENGWTGKIDVAPPKMWEQPITWKKPQRIFVNDMGDTFHPNAPKLAIHKIFDMADCYSQHTYIICTKRPERITIPLYSEYGDWFLGGGDYVPNVWFMTTAEDQQMADIRIPELLRLREKSPGWPVLAINVEPMLSSVNLAQYIEDIDWVVVGCESGPKRRPCSIEWVRYVRYQCVATGTPLFVKQLDIDGKVVHDIEQFPEDLRIRQYPGLKWKRSE